jgi:hypothetical protein
LRSKADGLSSAVLAGSQKVPDEAAIFVGELLFYAVL